MISVNYFAVFVAALSSMVVGFMWFGPLFGKTWMKLMGWSKKDLEKTKEEKGSEMNKLYAIQFIGSLAMAFVLSHALEFAMTYLGTEGVSAGLQTGFWNWLGFVAPVTLASVLWEGKSWKLYLFNNSYYLTVLLVMGVILAVWR
jgi:hypothetical protein